MILFLSICSYSVSFNCIQAKRLSLSINKGQNQFQHVGFIKNNNLSMTLNIPRGGGKMLQGALLASDSAVNQLTSSPSSIFNSVLVTLAVVIFSLKLWERKEFSTTSSKELLEEKPKEIGSIQLKFLIVFWLLRCADWLQGPYFYDVYASKVFNGVPASISLVSKLFLVGFASTAVFGPYVGRLSDSYGRKKGTIAYAALYAFGALSTKSPILWVLFAGRFLNGIGTSLLFSAPESWLVGSLGEKGSKYLGETFGLAYAGDSIVAIAAGQFAGLAASARGSTAPFELSVVFLALGALLTSLLWKENVAPKSSSQESNKLTIRDGFKAIKNDSKIMLVGAVQAFFEAAMYIFVLQWPPALTGAITKVFGESAITPYGTIFSCFMACCLLGSTIFGRSNKGNLPTEILMSNMLAGATLSMGLAAVSQSFSGWASLLSLIVSFCSFETCVGMYFPSIGTIRSKYIPDSQRSVIMNIFGIPLNLLVVSVFLCFKFLGVTGALGVSTISLAVATLSMMKLRFSVQKQAPQI